MSKDVYVDIILESDLIVEGVPALKCHAMNGYAGWLVREESSGDRINHVIWVDPDLKTYCAHDVPFSVVGAELASTVYAVEDIRTDHAGKTFWIKRAAVTVAPLSPGRQQAQEPTNKPCPECCQEETCRRLDWCAAHKCGFGERAP